MSVSLQCTFLLKSLLSLLLFYWKLYFLFPFLLKSLLSLYFSIEIFTFSVLSYWNLSFLFTFLLESLRTFSLRELPLDYITTWLTELFNGELPLDYFTSWLSCSNVSYLLVTLTTHHMQACTTSAPELHCERLSRLASPNVTTHHMCACTTSAPALHCEKQSRLASPPCNSARKNFKEKLCPACHAALRRHRAETAPHTASRTTSICDPAHSDLLWKHRDSHASILSNLHIVPHLPHKAQPVS